jgi:cation diffusion facilitator CzcD-associated flavoprotein CzcO
MTTEHFDILIVGAGLSGIGAAYHLQVRCPTKRYAILEGREASGGIRFGYVHAWLLVSPLARSEGNR